MKFVLYLIRTGLIMSLLVILPAQADGSCCTTTCTSTCNTPSVPATTQPRCRFPKAYLNVRSQSVNAARELVGWEKYINRFEPGENVYGALSITPEYTSSFRPDLLTTYFFGPAANCGCIKVSGSLAPDRGQFDFLADYFGLPQDFESTICFKPRIQNILADINLYVGLDSWVCGTYFRIHAPLVHTRWGLNPCEKVLQEGTLPYPPGYMTVESVPRANLPENALQALSGNATFADLREPLLKSKISLCTLTKTRLSDVEIALGWNFCNTASAHVGANIRTSLPAGNKPKGEFLFEPIVGNGGHYTLGLGLTSHLLLWEGSDGKAWNFYCDINAHHIFGAKEVRTFDWVLNGPSSRYILLASFVPIPRTIDNQPINGTLSNPGASHQYAGELTYSANSTNLCAEINIQIETDAVFLLSYTHEHWQFDIGYNFWARSKERVTVTDELNIAQTALKGDAFLYGAQTVVDISTPDNQIPAGLVLAARAIYPANAIALQASEDNTATIYTGSNYSNIIGVSPLLNPGVDSPEDSQGADSGAPDLQTWVVSPVAGAPNTPIQSSNPVNFDAQSDDIISNIDPLSVTTPSVVTHKVFGNISYNLDSSNTRLHYFIGVGGEVEFDAKRKGSCPLSCDCRSALNQWGVWTKGGVAF